MNYKSNNNNNKLLCLLFDLRVLLSGHHQTRGTQKQLLYSLVIQLEVFCILNEKERKERKELRQVEKKRKDRGSRDCRSDKSQGAAAAAAALVSDSLCVSALACVPCRAQGGGKNCSNYRDRVTSGFSTVSLFI